VYFLCATRAEPKACSIATGRAFSSLIIGTPAKVAKTLSDEVVDKLLTNVNDYRARAAYYTTNLARIG
jgi:S-adenosylmethionine synthetase